MAASHFECAAEQGHFWPMFEVFFRVEPAIDDTLLKGAAAAIGADVGRFQKCIQGAVSERVQRDITDGASLGVTATPTFFVGTLDTDGSLRVAHRIIGAQALAAFDRTIADLMASVQKAGGRR